MRKFGMAWYLAFQYVRRGRVWTLALTILLMSVAFVNLLFVSSLLNGIVEGSNQQTVKALTGDIYITPKLGNDEISNRTEVTDTLKRTSEIDSYSQQYILPAQIEYKNIVGRSSIAAITPSHEQKITKVHSSMTDGEYLQDDDKDGVIIGQLLAGGEDAKTSTRSFRDAKVGDNVMIQMGPLAREFTIRGIFKTRYIETDSNVFMTRAGLAEFAKPLKDTTNNIVISLKKDTDREHVRAHLEKELSDVEVHGWQDAAGTIKNVSDSFGSINAIMLSVGIMIAGVTIFIIIYIDIINKRRQIGIQRALGINPSIIVTSYVILSLFYALLGIGFGTLLFYAVLVPYFLVHPFKIPIADASLYLSAGEYFFRAGLIVATTLISGIIPALLASRMHILDAILGRK